MKYKSLKYVIMNFHIFMRKLALQTCAEQLISGVEFQIGQNNRYELPRYEFRTISKRKHLVKLDQKTI